MKKNIVEDKVEKKTFKRFLQSFKFSFSGIRHAFYKETNLFVMIIVAILVMIAGILLKISYEERLITIILIGIILSLELINSAIEATVNLVTLEKNPFAKIAKDCSSGAVLLMSIVSAIVGLMIFVPKIIDLF